MIPVPVCPAPVTVTAPVKLVRLILIRTPLAVDPADTVTGEISGVSVYPPPATGTVNASVGFVTWEGDRGLTGEQVLLNGTQLSDASRPATNFFNSAISDAGVPITARSPNYANNLGFDIGRINGEHFAVMAGAGLDALMIHDADGPQDNTTRPSSVVLSTTKMR